jgi:hypothetical protein
MTEMSESQKKALEKLLKRNPHPLEEDQVKELLRRYLESQNWKVEIKMGKTRGIDIDARKGTARWIIEAKGWGGGSEQQQGNYFWTAVAEILQRMTLDDAEYSLAFPDIPRYQGLWDRFPNIAKRRTGISCLFVNKEGAVIESR